MNLKNKTVLITGSSKGIGRAIALTFAKEGATVIINHRKSEHEASAVLEECNKYGADNLLVQADVSKHDQVKKMFEDIKEKYGSLDILINNAGYSAPTDLKTGELDEWRSQMDNNFFNTVYVATEFLALKGSEKLRKIVNVSSIYGFNGRGSKNYMAYNAAKAAVNNLTLSMAKKYAPNILVNSVAPGYVLTPLWGEMTQEDISLNGNEQLIERFITPEEIADGVVFLTKNDSMTGTILIMDGGLSLKTN